MILRFECMFEKNPGSARARTYAVQAAWPAHSATRWLPRRKVRGSLLREPSASPRSPREMLKERNRPGWTLARLLDGVGLAYRTALISMENGFVKTGRYDARWMSPQRKARSLLCMVEDGGCNANYASLRGHPRHDWASKSADRGQCLPFLCIQRS